MALPVRSSERRMRTGQRRRKLSTFFPPSVQTAPTPLPSPALPNTGGPVSTARTRSTLPAWGALLVSCAVVVAGCTSTPVATGTLPPTTSVTSIGSDTPISSTASSTRPSPTTSPSQESSSTGPVASPSASESPLPSPSVDSGPISVTVPTNAPQSPDPNPAATLDVPAGASQRTVGGASDFLQWWLKLGAASLQARDTSVLETYTSQSCTDCADSLTRINEIVKANQSVRSDGAPWSFIFQIDEAGPDTVDAVVYLESPPAQYINADGSVARDRNPFHYVSGISVTWNGSHWMLDRFRDLA